MIYTRIRSYKDNQFTGCEHLYLGDSHVNALTAFRMAYPEHKDCILIAENYDSDDPKNAAHFAACVRCGCVH